MFNMLVVDDEPIAIQYLVDVLREFPDLEVEITQFTKSAEAMDYLMKQKIDILLTDIRMPGTNGLELAEHALGRWPRCKVIFLTGYDDFSYIQTALRQSSVDYVLKTEGDEAIIDAIQRAIMATKAEMTKEDILRKARQQFQDTLPILQRDYLLDLIKGEDDSLGDSRQKRFSELGLNLDPESSVLLILGRIDEWGHYETSSDRSLMMYSIQNIAEEYFSQTVKFKLLQLERSRFVWFIQPTVAKSIIEETDWLNIYHYVRGNIESIQAACAEILRVPLSLAIALGPCPWEKIMVQYDSLNLMLRSVMGRDQGIIISDHHIGAGQISQDNKEFMEEREMRAQINKIDLLETHLDNGDIVSFQRQFNELIDIPDVLKHGVRINYLTLEMFYSLSVFFVSYLNRRVWLLHVSEHFSIFHLMSLDKFSMWTECVDYFREIGLYIAEYNRKDKEQYQNDLIRRLHQYINDYIHEELSLTKLAEVVYLSPPYLSRIYKQLTSQNLFDYITEVRLSKAKQLLKTSDLRIYEVAAKVGFTSAPYFTRFFKKVTDVTPQEYRDL